MAKYHRWNPDNKKAGRKKTRSKLGLTSRLHNIINKDEIIYGTVGIHPHESDTNIITKNEIVKNLKENPKIIGIGETGLDFYYNHSDKKSQIDSLEKHIQAAQQSNSTLIVHSRSAEKETFDVLNKSIKNKNFKILMHCFTGSKEFSKKLLDIGCYFSASGIITFKNSKELNDVFKLIPNDRIMLETDSPYLSPEPNRGKINEPSHIIHTLKHISALKDQNVDEFAKITSNNFFRLFNLKLVA